MPSRGSPFRRAAAAWLCAGLVACGAGDPLERVRHQQDVAHDPAGSLEPLRALIEERPDDPEVHFRHGVALVATGNGSQAIWSLRKALRSPRWVEPAGLLLAEVFVTLGSWDDAIETYGLVLERHPDHRAALLGRAMARIQSRRHYEDALADADRLLEIDPDDGEALMPRALALLALERADEAAPVLERIEALHRDESLGLHGSPGVCSARATFAKEKGEPELAEERYEKCLELFPDDPFLVGQAIEFFDERGETGRSERILADALEAAPADPALRARLVGRLLARGAKGEAEALVREATRLSEPHAAAAGWANVALWELGEGRYDEAAEAFGRARSLDPTGDPELAFGYADALVVAGRHEQALQVVEETGVPAYRALVAGRVALARGDVARALDELGEGVRLWPDNAIARYYLAVAAEQAGDFPTAVEHYRYALRVDGRATDAYLRLARLHAAAGRDDAALAILSFQPGGRPDELAGAQLHLEILARQGAGYPPHLTRFFSEPERRALGAAAIARGVGAGRGPEAAVRFLREQEPVDLTDPRDAPAIEALVDALAAAGRAAEGVTAVGRALRVHPDAAVLHALRGRALAHAGRGGEARAAFERALALEPEQPLAHAGLAALDAADGARDRALAHYERALAADAGDRASARAAAALLAELGRPEQAERRLEALLREHPWDAQAALSLAELRLARGADGARTRALARRAAEFRGGPQADRLLARLAPAGPAPDQPADAAPDQPSEADASPERGSASPPSM